MINGMTWVLSNLSLALFILAMIGVLVQKVFFSRYLTLHELIYRWVAFFALGISGFYGFVMHAFFPDFTAATIGWQNSPFQYEVAVANLGFGLMAILSCCANRGFRAATVIGNTCWLWGDAVGHVYQMITKGNFTNGNAGSWFWMDIIIPLVLVFCVTKFFMEKPHDVDRTKTAGATK